VNVAEVIPATVTRLFVAAFIKARNESSNPDLLSWAELSRVVSGIANLCNSDLVRITCATAAIL